MSLHSQVPSSSPPNSSVRWFTATAGLEAVGDSIARSLMPIVAVTVLGAGTATVGVINSLGLAAFLVLSVPVGVVADRWSAPTRMMNVGSLLRAVVTAAGVAAWLLGWLEGVGGIWILVLMALLVGIADVAYTAGQGLLVPRLVRPDQIRSVFGRVQTVSQSGGAAGPAILTVVLAVLAALPIPPAPPRTTMWAQAKAGTGQLFAQPVLVQDHPGQHPE